MCRRSASKTLPDSTRTIGLTSPTPLGELRSTRSTARSRTGKNASNPPGDARPEANTPGLLSRGAPTRFLPRFASGNPQKIALAVRNSDPPAFRGVLRGLDPLRDAPGTDLSRDVEEHLDDVPFDRVAAEPRHQGVGDLQEIGPQL